MAGVIDHPLVGIADQIASRAIPKEEQDTIRHLLYSVILYIKRVETGTLSTEEQGYQGHKRIRFRDIAPSKDIAIGLRDRLRILNEYRIRSVNRITEVLLLGFEKTVQRALTKEQVDILRVLSVNPLISIRCLSKNLGKSRYSIKKTLNQLQDQFGLLRFFHQNRGKLKLTTFSLVFRTKSFEDSKRLESLIRNSQPPFMTAFIFDVAYRNGYITYAIPSQHRALRLFEEKVKFLKQEFMEKAHLQRALEVYWNLRFDDYDSELGQWRIPTDLAEISRLPSLTEKAITEISYCNYSDLRDPCSFDRIDFLLSNLVLSSHHKMSELQNMLSGYGYDLSKNSIRLKLNRLMNESIISPTIYFSGGGLEEFILLSIICSLNSQKQLQLLASRFPFAFTYITQQGIAIFLKRPIGWRDFIIKIIRDITQQYEIDELMVIYQEHNLGSGLHPDLFRRWNEKRQYWEFTDEEIL